MKKQTIFKKSMTTAMALVFSLAAVTPAQAQERTPQVPEAGKALPLVDLALGPIPGFYPVRSDVFFHQDAPLAQFYPETAGSVGINTRNPVMANMVRAANQQGILYWVGYEANFARIFPLYRSAIGVDPSEDAATFGEIGMGLGHLPTHDLAHLLFAMVSPRFPGIFDESGNIVDQKKYADAQRELTKLLVNTEALASAWTSLQYVMDYMVWANDRLNKEGNPRAIDPAVFLNEMKNMETLFQMGKMSRKDFVRLTEAQTAGIFVEQETLGKTLYEAMRNVGEMVISVPKNSSPKDYQRRIEMGMPQLLNLPKMVDEMWNKHAQKRGLPPLNSKIRDGAVNMALKSVSGVIFAVEAMFRSYSGAKAFAGSSREFSKGLLKPWNVEYANRFRWGMTFDEALKNFDLRKQELIDGKFAASVPQTALGVTESMILRNEIVELGRKLVEVKWLTKFMQNEQGATESRVDLAARLETTEMLIKDLLVLHDTVYDRARTNQSIPLSQVEAWKGQLRSQVVRIESKLPVDTIIPARHRNTYMTYDRFWRNMFSAVGSELAGMDSGDKMRAFFNDELIYKRVLAIREHQAKHGVKSFPEPADDYMKHADSVAKLYIREVEEAFHDKRITDAERKAAYVKFDHRFGCARSIGDAFADRASALVGDQRYSNSLKAYRAQFNGAVASVDTAEGLMTTMREKPYLSFDADLGERPKLKVNSVEVRTERRLTTKTTPLPSTTVGVAAASCGHAVLIAR